MITRADVEQQPIKHNTRITKSFQTKLLFKKFFIIFFSSSVLLLFLQLLAAASHSFSVCFSLLLCLSFSSFSKLLLFFLFFFCFFLFLYFASVHFLFKERYERYNENGCDSTWEMKPPKKYKNIVCRTQNAWNRNVYFRFGRFILWRL